MNLETATKKLRLFFRSHRRLPSYKEMAELLGFASKKASFDIAKKLIELNILEKDSSGKLVPKNLFHPLPFLGAIQAGYPTPSEEQLYQTLSFDSYLINRPEHSYILKVNGDSMIDAGIYDGDMVVIEENHDPKNGDVVAAFIDEAWTLKYFFKENGKIRLVPANKKYPVLYPQEHLSIFGIVVSITRKYH
ncbi:hypothetical protein HYW54_03170 [Candidatus Gottesmanbacteria bacterium]|nr:hypothetical protein [Candidatus Gottesmanbacteria bacterium]